MDGQTFLNALATVLCAAAVTTVIFQWLRLPVVLGYLLAGMVVGPHIPVPLVADRAIVESLSELGVTLLMFSLGLEFSLRKLVRTGATSGLIMIIEVSTMLGLGYLAGRLLGFTPLEAIYTGAIVSISSTMMIAKSFQNQRPDRRHVELVFGVLVFEDLMAILLLAALTTLSAGRLTTVALAGAAGRLLLFLLLLLIAGLLLIPRLVRAVVRLGSAETLLVLSIGLCSAMALLAHAMGYSVALGAFVAGSLVAESGEGARIEKLVHPLRDLFGAVFFVSVGMSIDPQLLVRYWREVALLTAVVVGGKIFGVSLGAFLTGNSLRAALQAAMTLAQIGEFSFILAGLGVTQGATREFLYPIAVGVSAVTALLTPALMAAALPVATYVDRRLPRPLQQFMSLYSSWVERLRSDKESSSSPVRALGAWVLIDNLCIGVVYIVAALFAARIQQLAAVRLGLSAFAAGLLLAVVAGGLSAPFWVGLVRTSRRLAEHLSARAVTLPAQGHADLGATARRALSLTLHSLILVVAGAPLLAITQPFVPMIPWLLGSTVWAMSMGVIALSFWRNASSLLGHVRAGAQAVIALLAKQSHATEHEPAVPTAQPEHAPLWSGLGTWITHRVTATDYGAGKTLAELNLRGLTGATVLAIQREDDGSASPSAHQALCAGDVLALLGNAEAVASAVRLLRGDTTADAIASYEFFAVIGD